MPGMILKEDIEKVRATADLYDIVSATVSLKPSGTGAYVGLCPFHDEKTPSFSVRPALGVWHCFGCGLGGDVFGYVEHQENVDFRDAVELLADKYHIELHYDQSNAKKEHTGSKRARLLEANEAAQEFFVSQLMTKDALAARKLLDGRNFSQADCQRFGADTLRKVGQSGSVLGRQRFHAAGDAGRGIGSPRPAWGVRLFSWPRNMADSRFDRSCAWFWTHANYMRTIRSARNHQYAGYGVVPQKPGAVWH